MRKFNTAGPVDLQKHYALSPRYRLNLEEIEILIEDEKYFVLHAPRQTGKTSCLLSLMNHINNGDSYRALYVNVEPAQAAREDVEQGIRAILGEMASQARLYLNDDFMERHWDSVLKKRGPAMALNEMLTLWSQNSRHPVILLIDEIDSLVGDTLISVLRQIRAGYIKRPELFPRSIVLCGVRDIRDYRIHSSRDKQIITGGTAFNIKAESLRLGNFTRADIETLYLMHTQETGQKFEKGDSCIDNDVAAGNFDNKGVVEMVWALTEGQPWLVNALGYEMCFKMKENLDRSHLITSAMVVAAKESLIMRRETHLDQLVDKLKEERVRRVIEPILSGTVLSSTFRSDDVEYVRDIGLIEQGISGEIRLANRIYQEIIPRELAWNIQSGMTVQRSWYIQEDGRIDCDKLLRSFQEFFREHSEHWIERFQYREAGPQLLLQAFLQRVVNGGGRVEREYGLGRMRTDLLVIWPYGAYTQIYGAPGAKVDGSGMRPESSMSGKAGIQKSGAGIQKIVIEFSNFRLSFCIQRL
ncbi:MAG: ATP-binding protein [Desulfamplus sp.]|nr:ATP-binding protein [Desulfamplus sp.]